MHMEIQVDKKTRMILADEFEQLRQRFPASTAPDFDTYIREWIAESLNDCINCLHEDADRDKEEAKESIVEAWYDLNQSDKDELLTKWGVKV